MDINKSLNRPRPMAELAFDCLAEFSKGLAIARWHKDRIVAKATCAGWRIADLAFASAFEMMDRTFRVDQAERTTKTCGSLA